MSCVYPETPRTGYKAIPIDSASIPSGLATGLCVLIRDVGTGARRYVSIVCEPTNCHASLHPSRWCSQRKKNTFLKWRIVGLEPIDQAISLARSWGTVVSPSVDSKLLSRVYSLWLLNSEGVMGGASWNTSRRNLLPWTNQGTKVSMCGN